MVTANALPCRLLVSEEPTEGDNQSLERARAEQLRMLWMQPTCSGCSPCTLPRHATPRHLGAMLTHEALIRASLTRQHGEVGSVVVRCGPRGQDVGAGRCQVHASAAKVAAGQMQDGWWQALACGAGRVGQGSAAGRHSCCGGEAGEREGRTGSARVKGRRFPTLTSCAARAGIPHAQPAHTGSCQGSRQGRIQLPVVQHPTCCGPARRPPPHSPPPPLPETQSCRGSRGTDRCRPLHCPPPCGQNKGRQSST